MPPSRRSASRPTRRPSTCRTRGPRRSVVLNSLRAAGRRGSDPRLPRVVGRPRDEPPTTGRAGSRPTPPSATTRRSSDDLEKDYLAAKLGGNLAGFETEALCRWVPTTRESWSTRSRGGQCRAEEEAAAARPGAGDQHGPATAGAHRWPWRGGGDDTIGHVQLLFDVTGDPIDTDTLGVDMPRWRPAGRVVRGRLRPDDRRRRWPSPSRAQARADLGPEVRQRHRAVRRTSSTPASCAGRMPTR